MKIENLDAIETYPTNYDNIDKKTRDIIVEYLNDQQALAELYYKHHNITKHQIVATEKKVGLGFINSTVTCFEIENYVEWIGIFLENKF